jgi:transposase InsO family protein
MSFRLIDCCEGLRTERDDTPRAATTPSRQTFLDDTHQHAPHVSQGQQAQEAFHDHMERHSRLLKRELLLGNVFYTRQERRGQIFEYLEVFYNRQRRYSTLGYKAPLEFEGLDSRAVA